MAFHVRDQVTDMLVRELAQTRGIGLTEAVRTAVEHELGRIKAERAIRLTRMREISDRVASWPKTGLKADKAFFDEMSGD